MALLEVTQSRQITATIRLEEQTAAQVDQYAAFINASADDVVNQALEYVFSKDRDFQEYLKSAEAASAVPTGWTALALQNGWTGSPFGTSVPAVRSISGIVHFKGAIATTGANPVPFTLPAGFRPASAVFVPVSLCNAAGGRLQIEPTGVVTVQAEGGAFSNAACFTSLDGASFAP